MALTIVAPCSGWVAPLEEVPDAVFAERILGDGVAIDPSEGRVCAPCDGEVIGLAKHAVTLRAENGAEIIIHVGLETVALKGEGFTPLTEQGAKVKAGDPLLAFDLDLLAQKAKSLITPIILANGEGFTLTSLMTGREIAAGEALFSVEPRVQATAQNAKGETATRRVIIASEHGLHARPAAVLAAAAKAFAGEVSITCQGRSANAKSAIAVMALGIRYLDEVLLRATGEHAEETLAKLAALLDQPHKEEKPSAPAIVASKRANAGSKIFGVTAAPGRVVGIAAPLGLAEIAVPEEGCGLATETAALQEALSGLRADIAQAAGRAKGAQREILAAHMELLSDLELHAAASALIAENKSAAFAWKAATRRFAKVFRSLQDPRLRERAADLLDLEHQMLARLIGVEVRTTYPPNAILIADEILPSHLSDASSIAGILSARGGPTSHVAILAAAMNIPALVGAGEEVLGIAEGSEILLDASGGFVDAAPDAATISQAKEDAALSAARASREKAEAQEITYTTDGARIEVFANLGKGAEEAASAVAFGAEGCGLLRTEFLFMERETPPSEDEQRAAYQAIAEALQHRPFILRTFDIGADKPVAYLSFPPEDNPQLGLRGIRAGLEWPQLLTTQLKAAASVTPFGCCRILLPMITALPELRAIRALLSQICADANLPIPPLGVMIETPSSALLADQLIAEADFLSIGTNDLTQYTLAIDRTHATLSKQLDALHPAVLRLIAKTAEAANAAGKIAAICGGLAADPAAVPVLIGLGVKELSMPAPAIPRVKALIRALHIETCRALAAEALACDSAEAVRALLQKEHLS